MKKLLYKIFKIEHEESEIIQLLKSIDSRLNNLEKCVANNQHGFGKQNYIVTGNWNE